MQRLFTSWALGLCAILGCLTAIAHPDRPVRIIVAFSPGSFTDMVFHVAPTIPLMSQGMTLQPGDVLEIEGIGTLRNEVVVMPGVA